MPKEPELYALADEMAMQARMRELSRQRYEQLADQAMEQGNIKDAERFRYLAHLAQEDRNARQHEAENTLFFGRTSGDISHVTIEKSSEDKKRK